MISGNEVDLVPGEDDAGDSEIPLLRPAKRLRRASSVEMDELLSQFKVNEGDYKPLVA